MYSISILREFQNHPMRYGRALAHGRACVVHDRRGGGVLRAARAAAAARDVYARGMARGHARGFGCAHDDGPSRRALVDAAARAWLRARPTERVRVHFAERTPRRAPERVVPVCVVIYAFSFEYSGPYMLIHLAIHRTHTRSHTAQGAPIQQYSLLALLHTSCIAIQQYSNTAIQQYSNTAIHHNTPSLCVGAGAVSAMPSSGKPRL